MSIKAEIIRDDDGFPVAVTVRQGAKTVSVSYDKDTGLTVEGSRRSLTEELMQVLRLIYPAQEKIMFNIPQPLSVVTLQGGKILLYDDMESLLKWTSLSAALDNTVAYNGNQSLKITVLDADGTQLARRGVIGSRADKLRMETLFAVDDLAACQYVSFGFYRRYFKRLCKYSILCSVQNGKWEAYNNKLGIYEEIFTDALFEDKSTNNIWHRASFETDGLSLSKVSVDGRDYEINKKIYDTGTLSESYIQAELSVTRAAGHDTNVWFDDVKVEEV